MILQRIAAGLRQRDWGTVVLEIFIVVVGIYIGLQVDDWNEHRKDRAAEAEYLERLLADTVFNLDQVKAKAQSYHDRAGSLSRIVEQIKAGKVAEIELADLTNAFCYWYVPEGVRLQSATYDEMTATVGLELIRDQNIRQLLQMAWAEHDRSKDEKPKLSTLQVDLAKPLRKFTEWRFDAPIQEIDRDEAAVTVRAGCIVDRLALAADPAISSVLVQLNRSQTILGNTHLNEQAALEKLLAALEQAVAN